VSAETSYAGLPPVLQQSLPRRLRLAALTYAAVFLLMLVVNLLETALDAKVSFAAPSIYVTFATCILVGVAVAAWTHRSATSTRALYFVASGFQIVGTFGIAVASIELPLPEPYVKGYIGIPWTCPWILAYPLMVPSLPRHAAVAGVVSALACAAAVKFRLLVLEPAAPDPAPQIWVMMVFMNLVCVAWGTVGSVIINNLGREVTKARRVGSYQLERLLGTGGMGEVWEGRHRLLARPAAVKIIRSEMLGGGEQSGVALQRFEREAQATAALQSPHSVALYDYGVSDDGTFYYVMELLDGMDLSSLVEQFGPIAPERVLHWLGHACHSLAEAHHNGLIHRDIKPANLFTCRFGLEWDFLKVRDFGLVKPTGVADATAPALTAEHSVTGTAGFMPPEIAMGNREVDGRADLYALGCVAYWLLTAQLVFEAESSLNMIMQHVQAEPKPPSARTELELSPELEAIVLDCLKKDPAARPQSAAQLSERVARCPGADAWTQERARRWWETHRPARSSATAS
jgi:serine/threonine-protein kinase